MSAHGEGERKLAERTSAAGKLDEPVRSRLPAFVVLYMQSGDACHPQGTQLVIGGHVAAKTVQGVPQNRHRRRISVGEVLH